MIQQLTIFDIPRDFTRVRFDGPDVTPRDQVRLGKQLEAIYELMRDGSWRSLASIEAATGYPQASISAQLRHLRKPRFGKYTVERRRVGDGYQYRVI